MSLSARADATDLERAAQDAAITIGSKSFFADPYPVYSALRAVPPIYSEGLGGWLICRYEDVRTALGTPGLVSGGRVHALLKRIAPDRLEETTWIGNHFDQTLPFLRPPQHTVIRTILVKALSPRTVEGLRPGINELTASLLDAVDDDRFDLARSLTLPLPLAVIGLLMAIPPVDQQLFIRWTSDLFAIFGPASQVRDDLDRIGNGLRDARAYLADLVDDRAKKPGDDLVSLLLRVRDDDGRSLERDDIVANCLTLFTAGHETTQGLLGNGLRGLIQSPGGVQAVRQNRDLVRPAIEEMLRWDSPLQRGWRVAEKDVEIGGVNMAAGSLVFLLLASANHDESVFQNAQLFDPARNPNRHLAFGHGPHFCVGAGLARLEAEVVLEQVLRRYRRVELGSSPPVWRQDITFHVLDSLSVEVIRS